MTERRVIDLRLTDGMALRLFFLQSHYRQRAAVDNMPERLKAARKTLRRLYLACEPNLGPPPLEIVEAVSDDLNTPKALGILQTYRAQRRGKELFAGLRFLGLIEGENFIVSELKTYPTDHIFSAPQYIGVDAHEA